MRRAQLGIASERGFLLIGVIVFVLALSILGLSLYSLSSYEAQFLRQSRDSNTALYRAEGGIEMVKGILGLPPQTLKSAKTAMGHEGVWLANAYQVSGSGIVDSLGGIDYARKLSVDVLVRQGGTSRWLHSDFMPQPRQDYYKRLFTVAGLIECTGKNKGANNQNSAQIAGRIWQPSGFDSTSWVKNLKWTNGPPFQRGAVALPDLDGYFATHPVGASVSIDSGQAGGEGAPNENVIHLDSGTGIRYYQSPWPATYNRFANKLKVKVRDTAVWLFPSGFRGEHTVTLEGYGSNPTLVIVGAPNGTEPGYQDIGAWFFGGINAQNVTLILVSSGGVRIEHFNDDGLDSSAPRLSVYASSRLWLMGPLPSAQMKLAYDPAMDALIDNLYANAALPLPSGGTANSFSFVSGSWRELKP